ncbi:SDR family NAD(P)-dependent oxidoreductase [Phyllobacterium zundukense]|uniref:3-oxoacyl-ACP reductase n=1 Tax=Phyllobacterium zundukense TaxID=1867719 RepID=A0A2N9VXL2_9HYPH|nr:SDR family oxidoreductase [Phyllobacterium zundukense]ATU95769.1 3-oxoacyl-ACP reductase [Phyllobacterium zundukense]PIO44230.1 3-oxoacyl-ACP reductase [Phyllobacterium zundukense]
MMPSAIFPDLKDRSVLITGGGSGIGAALTEGFVRQGCRVAFIDIADEPSQALVERLGKEHGNSPLYLKADLTDVEELRNAVAKAIDTNGLITVLVNNAAWDDRHDIDDVTVEYWDRNQSINLRPQFFAAQAVVPGMRQSGGGSIINFTSTSYMINQGNMPSYTAAKAGIIGLTKGLAGRLGPDNIRVNAIAPGWVMTDRQRTHWVTEEGLRAHMNKQVLREEIQPGDMVGPCLFLASDAARMLSAQTLIVDGGYL